MPAAQPAMGEINQGGLDQGALDFPRAITFDAAGDAFVTDSENSRVLEYVSPYPVSARIALGTGWNLVALPSQTSLPYSAATIVKQIDGEGGNAKSVAIYRNGAYKVYVSGFSSDFAVMPTEGFFVLMTSPSVWTVT